MCHELVIYIRARTHTCKHHMKNYSRSALKGEIEGKYSRDRLRYRHGNIFYCINAVMLAVTLFQSDIPRPGAELRQ